MQSIYLTGICCDHNSTFIRGPASAPMEIRKALFSGSANLFSEGGKNIEEIVFFDADDHIIEESEKGYMGIVDIITTVMDRGSKPLVLGGDHSITYPVIEALARKYTNLTILHFDAHPDLYNHYKGNYYAHACPFTRIMEKALATRLIQLGIRTLNALQAEQADRFGVEIHQIKDSQASSLKLNINAPLYISIDMDVFDPAHAPGVSHHEPGGMSVREVLNIIQSLDCKVVGADIVEYNPSRDINDMTAMVAAKLVKELAAIM